MQETSEFYTIQADESCMLEVFFLLALALNVEVFCCSEFELVGKKVVFFWIDLITGKENSREPSNN